jgi:hypothetical protein
MRKTCQRIGHSAVSRDPLENFFSICRVIDLSPVAKPGQTRIMAHNPDYIPPDAPCRNETPLRPFSGFACSVLISRRCNGRIC